ncbi:hypothetical protein BDV95DRAFT_500657 [Massariosphaeria phaeospora]|uniref:Store-operated calcium entry-associated regulatory factor n=1 Tax=Massariosphaeria phaeospora TaxID=100035 RepID=A0A7C8I1G6_9PLEO|nr:hypothetical protein BDV95DRAFT_500657 [Massariosphaeria phaeospora]
MHYLDFLYPALLATTSFLTGAEALRSDKIKLSNVKTLTLRQGKETSHRRVSAVPQLKCIGGPAKGLYEVDVMRCENTGYDYNQEDVQWTCKASLPEEFKLGSTDVICEGYDSSEDPYVLKGSCGVEYRLALTSKGEEKYGKVPWHGDDEYGTDPQTGGEKIATALFWIAFIGVALFIVYKISLGWAGGAGATGGAGNRPGWGGGGGGGGWGADNDDDPPPPYDPYPSGQNPKSGSGGTQGWRPGPWTGALGGAAAAYAAGRMGNRNNQTGSSSRWGNGGGSSWNNGEGSSRPSSGSSTFSSNRQESTGFGSTSRR